MTNSLTSLKFLCALAFFVFHMQYYLSWKTGIDFIDNFCMNGPTFMTGFFVMTGVILTHVYQKIDFSKDKNIFDFYIKRFAKVYPLYIASSFVYFLFYSDQFMVSPVRIFFDDVFLYQAYFPSIAQLGFNQITWFLSAKLFFFFIFPFLLIVINGKAIRCFIPASIILFLILVNVLYNNNDNIYGNPFLRIADVLTGIGCYLIKDKIYKYNKFGMLHIVSFILLIICCESLGNINHQHMLGQFLINPLFGIWVICVYHSKSIIFNNRILFKLGETTFAFFLWQFVVIFIGKYLINNYDLDISLVVFICLIMDVMIGLFFHHIIEVPSKRFILMKFGKHLVNKTQ